MEINVFALLASLIVMGVVFLALSSFASRPPCDLSHVYSAIVFGETLQQQPMLEHFGTTKKTLWWSNKRADVFILKNQPPELEFTVLVRGCRGRFKLLLRERLVVSVSYHVRADADELSPFQEKFRLDRLSEFLLAAYDATVVQPEPPSAA